jgi:hypothetical protein
MTKQLWGGIHTQITFIQRRYYKTIIHATNVNISQIIIFFLFFFLNFLRRTVPALPDRIAKHQRLRPTASEWGRLARFPYYLYCPLPVYTLCTPYRFLFTLRFRTMSSYFRPSGALTIKVLINVVHLGCLFTSYFTRHIIFELKIRPDVRYRYPALKLTGYPVQP